MSVTQDLMRLAVRYAFDEDMTHLADNVPDASYRDDLDESVASATPNAAQHTKETRPPENTEGSSKEESEGGFVTFVLHVMLESFDELIPIIFMLIAMAIGAINNAIRR